MAKEKETVVKDNRDKAVDDVIKTVKKAYGEGSIMRLGEQAKVSVDAIPSGSLALDAAIGIGGYPKGRVVEIFGPESSGKTTLALHAIAECQKRDGRCAFIDVENAIDPVYAKNLGVNIDELILSQPDSGEQALDIADILVKSGAIDLIVVDSVAALVPQQELDGEMGDATMAAVARLMSKAIRKLTPEMSRTGTTMIFINQLREKVGILFGNPETTPGGRALKYAATVRLDVRKGEALKNGSDVYGSSTKIRVVKNKAAAPFKTAVVNIIYGEGISHADELINIAVENDIINKAGAWFSYGEEKIGQGIQSVREYLKSHPEFEEEISEKIKAKLFHVEDEGEEAEAKA